jgi:hypothetical protein
VAFDPGDEPAFDTSWIWRLEVNGAFPLMLGLLLVAGCTASSVDTTTALPSEEANTVAEETTLPPTSTSTSTTVAVTTTTTGPAEPVVRGPSAYVIGREDCKIIGMEVPLTETRPEPGLQKGRDGEFVCTVTNNDPRVAGTSRYTLNQNRWGTGPQNGNIVQWGTIHLENDQGAWDADYLGIYTSETGDVVTSLFTGSGDYEGLSYYRWAISFGQSWETQGVIFPNIEDP